MRYRNVRFSLLITLLAICLCALLSRALAEPFPSEYTVLAPETDASAWLSENQYSYFRFAPEETGEYELSCYAGDYVYCRFFQAADGTLLEQTGSTFLGEEEDRYRMELTAGKVYFFETDRNDSKLY